MAIFSNMISVFFLVFFVGIASSNPAGNNGPTQLIQSINQFVQDVLEVVSKEYAGKNFVTSPVSTNILLALLAQTAQGQTLAELIAGLHQTDFKPADYKSTVDKMTSSHKGSPQLALKVYINSDVKGESAQMNPNFKQNAVDFGLEAQFINFTKQNESAAEMNDWVEKNTNNGITDLVNPADLHNDSSVVLIDALSFEGDFEQQFKPMFTWNDTFHPNNSEPIQLPTMHEFVENFPYDETDEEQILWLPIKGGYNLIINLPKENSTKKNDSSADYSEANKPELVQAYVALPKFHIETTVDDKTILSKLGMGTLFSDKAELGVLANPQSGGVTKSLKKTVINVDEQGVSAAIATGQVVENKSPSQKSNVVVFIANKPFHYTLASEDGEIFLSGQFTGKN